MGYGQATSVYAYLYIYIYHATSFLTNTVFLNTTSGLRKLPEYFIFADQRKFKIATAISGWMVGLACTAPPLQISMKDIIFLYICFAL